MSKHWLAGLALIVALVLFTPSLMAKNEKSHGKGNPHATSRYRNSGRGWENRDGYQYRAYRHPNERPDGWSRGSKTGWNYCGAPPGQANRYGCRTYVYQGRPHYYYRDTRGQYFVRRPIIIVH